MSMMPLHGGNRYAYPLPCLQQAGVTPTNAVQTGDTARRNSEHNNTARPTIDRSTRMKFLSYAYRFLSNFVFLALVYFSLNFLEKYQQRAMRRDSGADLCGDARGVGAAFVLFLPAYRAARARGAPPRRRGRGRSRPHPPRASKSSVTSRTLASRRRNEVLYRSVVSRLDRAAVRFEDRDRLKRFPAKPCPALDAGWIPVRVRKTRLIKTQSLGSV